MEMAGKALADLLAAVNGFVWGWPLVALLFGTHIYLTIRLRIIQRYIPLAIRLSLRRTLEGRGDISHFGALATALAATTGAGNIIGVGTAVATGGPGAVLWMWLTGVFGIATKYSEALLSVHFRTTNDRGQMSGGPMYVLERGLGMKWMGVVFAVLTAIAAFGIGNMVQANSIANLMEDTLKVPHWMTGLGLTVLTGLVIIGGVKSIARVCERLVPFMCLFYIAGCVLLLVIHLDRLPATLELIFRSAFVGQAAIGGFAGAIVRDAVQRGVARGLFSNESGMGSAPILAAAAQTKNPVRQALVSSTGTFWDTVVICLLTGLVVVNSGDWTQGLAGNQLTHAAFSELGQVGPLVLTLGLLTFVFSAMLGWCYYGEKAMEYLLGVRSVPFYRIVFVLAAFVGAISLPQAVWDFADIANGLMAIPNLISLLMLTGVLVSQTRKYLWEDRLELDVEDEPSQMVRH